MSFLCTTLIPSYKRPWLLLKAIRSFRQTAFVPECHQVVVRISDADPYAHEQCENIRDTFQNVHAYVGGHMAGYNDLGYFYTEMLQFVQGDWINIWDDDMTMEGAGWDDKLRQQPKWALVVCERYHLGPNLYDIGSCDDVGIAGFLNFHAWKEAGETAIGFPPDTYFLSVARKNQWPVCHLPGTVLRHNWQRPKDGDR